MDNTFSNREIFTKKSDGSNDTTLLSKASFVTVVSVQLFTVGNGNISVTRNNEFNSFNSDSVMVTKNSGKRGGIQLSSDEVSKKDLENLEKTTQKDIYSLERLISERLSHTDTKIENAVNELKAEIEKSRNSNARWFVGIVVTTVLSFIGMLINIMLQL